MEVIVLEQVGLHVKDDPLDINVIIKQLAQLHVLQDHTHTKCQHLVLPDPLVIYVLILTLLQFHVHMDTTLHLQVELLVQFVQLEVTVPLPLVAQLLVQQENIQ